MKTLIFSLSLLLLGFWLFLSYFFLGHVKIEWLSLALPKTTAEFGDSIGTLNGLFSSIAVILALVAVLLQGKGLKASTKAQHEQADALKQQLENQGKITEEQLRRSRTMIDQLQQQQMTNKIIILQAQQQYHSTEILRMDGVLEQIESNPEKVDLFKNCVEKKKGHIAELKKVSKEFENLG